MEPLPLSFAVLLNYLYVAVHQIVDPRQTSNATRYKLGDSDVILGAFSVFFMQCESFLEHQRQTQSRRGKDNAQSSVWDCRDSKLRANPQSLGWSGSGGTV
ncbi:MAG: hypothetical protein MUC48_25120 [Leptolyngbya sp. Prado105]|jgi:hypothetical protein|nr:hypothetical protein [Leptolyngbya sp. Prado105]